MSDWRNAPIVENNSWQNAPIVEPESNQQERTLSERVFRGLSMGARYLAETPALTVAGIADLGSSAINKGMDAWGVVPGPYRLPTNRAQTVYEGFSDMGFPESETPLERTGERISRAVVGAAAGPAVGARLAASQNPVTSSVGSILQQAPTMQGASAVTGAIGGDIAERNELGPKGQMLAEMAGAMVAPASLAAQRAVTGTARAGLGVKDAVTTRGQRKIAGNVIHDAAINPDAAAKNIADDVAYGSGISQKTTGQASRDPGILTLERAARSMDQRGQFGQRASQANVARQKILDVMRGPHDKEVLIANRNNLTGAQRTKAFAQATPMKSDRIVSRIDQILKSPQGKRQVVRSALETYKKDIDGIDDVRVLYEVRKDINDAMQGKFSRGDRSDFSLAKTQLKIVKNEIDDVIELSAPGFKKYLETYASLSRDIDKQGILENIQNRAVLSASDPSTVREILSNARFKRMVNAEAANGVLDKNQLIVLRAIADDLDSGQAINATTIRPPGSDTAKNLTVAHVIGRATGGRSDSPFVRTMARPLRWMVSLSEDEVQGLIVDAMLDPRLARMLLAEAKPQQIARASKSLQVLAGASAVGGALGSSPQIREQAQ